MAVQSGTQVSTRLSDLPIAGEVFSANVILRMLQNNAFLNSGVMVRDSELDAFLSSNIGGKVYSPRFIGPLALVEPNISNDNPADKSTPQKITGGKMSAVRQSLNQSWSSMDLNVNLLGLDPIGAIEGQVADYWRGISAMRLLASLQGVIAGNIANDSGDMVVDISGEADAAALINSDAIRDAAGSMGDMQSALTAIAVHGVVYNTLLKNEDIEFLPDSEGKSLIAFYQQKRVIVDDSMTVVPGTPNKYYTYLFGSGAISLGVGSPKVPFEIIRDGAAGMGGGEEVLHSRVEWMIHPQGFSFGLTDTPTTAQLQDAANWTRVLERKRIPLAAIISQG